jgi:hypothetical protein
MHEFPFLEFTPIRNRAARCRECQAVDVLWVSSCFFVGVIDMAVFL